MIKTLLTAIILFLVCTTSYSQEYLVGDGDLLEILVYEHPDLTTVSRITGSGKINFPLVGEIMAGGLTVQKLKKKIEDLLSDGYIVNPSVSIFIKEYKSKKVVVMGEVNKPGLVELRGDATLLEVISEVGGITEDAGDVLYIQRNKKKKSGGMSGGEEKETITVDIKKLLEGKDQLANISIQEQDSIYVTEAAFCFVNGEVKRPGSYKITKGLTVVQAITLAGGFIEGAAKSKIEITRKGHADEAALKANLNDIVEPEDIIFVPESFFYVNGEVKRPGSFKTIKGLTVLKAITIAGGFSEKAAERKVKIIRNEDGKEVTIKVKMNDIVKPDDIVFVPESFF